MTDKNTMTDTNTNTSQPCAACRQARPRAALLKTQHDRRCRAAVPQTGSRAGGDKTGSGAAGCVQRLPAASAAAGALGQSQCDLGLSALSTAPKKQQSQRAMTEAQPHATHTGCRSLHRSSTVHVEAVGGCARDDVCLWVPRQVQQLRLVVAGCLCLLAWAALADAHAPLQHVVGEARGLAHLHKCMVTAGSILSEVFTAKAAVGSQVCCCARPCRCCRCCSPVPAAGACAWGPALPPAACPESLLHT